MSKKQNNQNVKVEEVFVNETTEVNVPEETKKEGLGKKLLSGVKKHGKKIAAGAAVVAGGIICYTIGAKTGKSGSSEGDGVDEIAYYDLPPIEETVDNASE